MLRRILMRAPAHPQACRHRPAPRRYTASTSKPPVTPRSRIDRVNRRLPAFLHKYTRALGNAPLTHVTSFLLLHELTAIIPLFALAAYFHYTHWLPPWLAEGAWLTSGVERFGRYFKRKGWIRGDEAATAEAEVGLRKVDRAWNWSKGGVRLVVEFATAYALTKMLLVPRVMLSVWATPWFARWTVIPVLARVKAVLKTGRGKKKT